MTDDPAGTLYVVSTPIGNMGDFSFRAIETLRMVDAILAEDTRHTRHLMDRYEIDRPTIAHHQHNEARSTVGVVERLLAGESFALVTDAGTPLVSDPGQRLVQAAIGAGIRVVPIPGPSALLAALVASGIDASRFTFFGFLPRTGKDRREALEALASLTHTAVLYEAPARLASTLDDLAALGEGSADRECAVAREMTKQFEEVRRGTVAELAAYYKGANVRGELVVVLAGAAPVEVGEDVVRERVRSLREEGLSARDAAARAAKELGVSKKVAYRMTQELTQE